MGTDARVRYTRMVIRDAFLSLLREKSIKQITVTELCAISEINRATFYKHYRDTYDLLEQIELEMLSHLRETAEQLRGDNARERFVLLLENTREHHQEYAAVGSENGDPNFSQRVSACLYGTAGASVFRKLPELSEEKREMLYCFLERGGSGVLERWIRRGMTEEPEKVADMIFLLSDAVMRISGRDCCGT